MKTANYGRMRVGKCISEEEVSMMQNIKNIGCYSDVLDIMHSKCSFRNICKVTFPDKDLEKTRTCFPGLILYLEASYDCLQGMEITKLNMPFIQVSQRFVYFQL